jgi:hypothetical protein
VETLSALGGMAETLSSLIGLVWAVFGSTPKWIPVGPIPGFFIRFACPMLLAVELFRSSRSQLSGGTA